MRGLLPCGAGGRVIAALCWPDATRCPGKPKESDRPIRPSQVKDFAALYGENCSGCHGANGTFGAACALANPVYQLWSTTTRITRDQPGIAGTAMPPFAHERGGYLTGRQVAILVTGMRRLWKTGAPIGGAATLRQRQPRRSQSRRRGICAILRALPRA